MARRNSAQQIRELEMYKVVVTDEHGSFESSPMDSLAAAQWVALRMEKSDASVSAEVVECDDLTMDDADCRLVATATPASG